MRACLPHGAIRDGTVLTDPVNRSNCEAIERALLVLCLDAPITTAFNNARALPSRGHAVDGRDETNMAHHMLHGGGSKANSGNRWFDKTIQVSGWVNPKECTM